MEKQRELFHECESDPKKLPPRILILLDDCLNEKILREWRGVISQLASLGRHYKISLAVITQQFNAVQKVFRVNADFILLFEPYAISETEDFLDQFIPREYRKSARRVFRTIFEIPKFCILLCCHKSKWMERLQFTWTQAMSFEKSFAIKFEEID
jgi:hypothetical protein